MSYESEIGELIAEFDQFRNGNPALLEALMLDHEDRDIVNAARCVVLCEAWMPDEEGACNWTALEVRNPKQQTQEQAVRECITDTA
ncbi:MAG: hypothetical protein DCF23_02610 [Cyanobium sp.]|nr:MAG: hypothetical protein DCF23_02610 [Cyanobium sp.]